MVGTLNDLPVDQNKKILDISLYMMYNTEKKHKR